MSLKKPVATSRELQQTTASQASSAMSVVPTKTKTEQKEAAKAARALEDSRRDPIGPTEAILIGLSKLAQSTKSGSMDQRTMQGLLTATTGAAADTVAKLALVEQRERTNGELILATANLKHAEDEYSTHKTEHFEVQLHAARAAFESARIAANKIHDTPIPAKKTQIDHLLERCHISVSDPLALTHPGNIAGLVGASGRRPMLEHGIFQQNPRNQSFGYNPQQQSGFTDYRADEYSSEQRQEYPHARPSASARRPQGSSRPQASGRHQWSST